FLANPKQGEFLKALKWLLFREWLPANERQPWIVPRCPYRDCDGGGITFVSGGATEVPCGACGQTVYLSDTLRLYERIDEEQGAGGIMAYLLSTLEQLVLVDIIRALFSLKPKIGRAHV